MSWRIAEGLAYSLEPKVVLEDLVLPQLEIDPLNPGWLMVLTTTRGLQNDPEAVWEAVERAMELGVHHPRVRYARVLLMDRHEDLRWNATQEMKDAYEATNGDIVYVARMIHTLLSPQENMEFNKNGSTNQDFQCVRLMFLERHKAWCKANPSAKPRRLGGTTYCEGSIGVERDKIVNSTRLNVNCGQSVTWKDWLRSFLDSTE